MDFLEQKTVGISHPTTPIHDHLHLHPFHFWNTHQGGNSPHTFRIPGGLVWWRALRRLTTDLNLVESPQRTVQAQNAIIVTGINKRTHVRIVPKQAARRSSGGHNNSTFKGVVL